MFQHDSYKAKKGTKHRLALFALLCFVFEAAPARADMVNIAKAAGTYSGTVFNSNTATASVPIAAIHMALTVTKTANPTSGVKAGDVVAYTYTATNSGNVTLHNISMTDVHNATGPAPVPTGETLTIPGPQGALASSDDATPNNGIWGSLAPGATVTFTATYTVRQADVDGLQ